MKAIRTWQYWRTNPVRLACLIGLILLIAVLKAVQEAHNQDTHGDIYIFWSAGVNFMNGLPLYNRIGGAEEFLYPPVAPLVFQLLALMPFPVAVGVFTFFNVLAWIAVFRITYLILRQYFPTVDLVPAFTFGFLAAIRYFWHNIIWVNINEVVALLSLGGVYLYSRGRHNTALLLLTLATWMKVMPALLLLMLFIRRPLPTLVCAIGFSALLAGCVLLFRGIGQGVQDYIDFWQLALRPFLQAGKVYTDAISFSMPSMLAKLLTAAGTNFENHRYNLVAWPVPLVRQLSLLVQVLLLGMTCWRIWATRRADQVPLPVLMLVYLTMLLVAGVSWEGHFVTMALLLPGTYQLLTQAGFLRLRRWVVGLAVATGLMIYDTLGATLYDYAQGFSVISYLTLLLYGVAFRLSLQKTGSSIRPETQPIGEPVLGGIAAYSVASRSSRA